MLKSSIKPTATLIWSEQIEKLKKKFSSLTDSGLYFEKEKMEEMFQRLQGKAGRSKHEIFEVITKH